MSNSKIKEFILDVTPPILRNIFIRYKDRNAYPKFNQKYWSENKDNYEHELRVMVDAFLASDDYKQTTKYWSHLLRNNLESIREFGLKTYGQHAAKNYFNFTDFSDETIKNLTHTAGKFESIDIFKHHKGYSKSESIKHNILIQLLLNSVLKNERTVKLLQETNSLGFTYGDHPYFKTKFGIVTSDLLSSILEIESLFNTIDQFSPQKVLEIGAGSGRTANALLEFNPLLKYVIADIPPASFIAMSRLKHAYPDKKIYFACDQVELEQYLIDPNSWDILFLLPTLLTNFPLKYFDITLAIDCLHEMNANMRHFFAEIATAKSKLYYFKIWKSTTIPLDNLFLTSSDLIDFCFEYNMIKLFSRECKFPSNYSEFLFKTS